MSKSLKVFEAPKPSILGFESCLPQDWWAREGLDNL